MLSALRTAGFEFVLSYDEQHIFQIVLSMPKSIRCYL